ncbi:hypothetical protein GCM10020295_56900 [Streptomyces cinereospinus]
MSHDVGWTLAKNGMVTDAGLLTETVMVLVPGMRPTDAPMPSSCVCTAAMSPDRSAVVRADAAAVPFCWATATMRLSIPDHSELDWTPAALNAPTTPVRSGGP